MHYFIAGNFHNKEINKFFYGIVTVDLKKKSLPEIANNFIDKNFEDINSSDILISITSFNNIKI